METLGPAALAALLDKHGAALALYARQWCLSPEDAVQEAFLRLLKEQPPPTNVVAWLYRVVRNSAISAARSTTRRTNHEQHAARSTSPWFEASPDEALDATTLMETLAALPLEQREPIVLRIWSGLSFEQIADLTNTSLSTAYRRYVAGLAALRERHLACEIPKTRNR